MGTKFSDRDVNVMAIALKCMNWPVEIDYEQFAKLGGYKTAKSARDTFSMLKKKLMAELDGEEAGTASKKSRGTKRKPQADDNDEKGPPSPIKKKPATKGAAAKKGAKTKAKQEPVEEDEDEEGDNITLKLPKTAEDDEDVGDEE